MATKKDKERLAKLESLQRQGVVFVAAERRFECSHCGLSLATTNVVHAKRHTATQAHLRNQADQRWKQQQDRKLDEILARLKGLQEKGVTQTIVTAVELQKDISAEAQLIDTGGNQISEEEAKPETQPTKGYETKLAFKSPSAQRSYKRHIKAFQQARGRGGHFGQDDIDGYFAQLHRADLQKPEREQESTATKKLRKAALRLYLNDHLRLAISFKDYKTKSCR